jgi:diguanylate cyclase (GGDEF)-like protein
MAGVLSATLRDAMASQALRDSNSRLNLSNALLKVEKGQLESEKDTLQTLADTDGMTGLKNHRYFQQCLAQEYLRAKRYHNALSLIILDIDYFKQYNDEFGHPAGDEVIKQVAELLKTSARPSDCVARYGGEEFALILTETSQEGALKTAQRIRKSIVDSQWRQRPITVSIGISSLNEDTPDALSIIHQADKALYQSKANGRDMITSFAA